MKPILNASPFSFSLAHTYIPEAYWKTFWGDSFVFLNDAFGFTLALFANTIFSLGFVFLSRSQNVSLHHLNQRWARRFRREWNDEYVPFPFILI